LYLLFIIYYLSTINVDVLNIEFSLLIY